MPNTTQRTMLLVQETRKLVDAIEKIEGRKVTEREFTTAKRLAQLSVMFPNGFRRYRVRNYERGEFRAK